MVPVGTRTYHDMQLYRYLHICIGHFMLAVPGCSDHDMLNISPGEVRVGLQRKSYDGSGHGGTGTGTCTNCLKFI